MQIFVLCVYILFSKRLLIICKQRFSKHNIKHNQLLMFTFKSACLYEYKHIRIHKLITN